MLRDCVKFAPNKVWCPKCKKKATLTQSGDGKFWWCKCGTALSPYICGCKTKRCTSS